MVTLKMLAKECGVSVATVSKALNGASDISAETALRIQQTASAMGYTPNSAARALKTSRSHNLGVIGALADNVLVLKDGKCVEYGRCDQVLSNPGSAYAKALLSAVPRLRR